MRKIDGWQTLATAFRTAPRASVAGKTLPEGVQPGIQPRAVQQQAPAVAPAAIAPPPTAVYRVCLRRTVDLGSREVEGKRSNDFTATSKRFGCHTEIQNFSPRGIPRSPSCLRSSDPVTLRTDCRTLNSPAPEQPPAVSARRKRRHVGTTTR
jgi:hypothetical protein